ncbi:ribosomal RNA-processing protein 7-domain-containing protein [Mrakia frigida]|uniref:Rrp7p n=1 Tax=Mrakia frigida TaxID=29902 RepID=UPI003FCBEF34
MAKSTSKASTSASVAVASPSTSSAPKRTSPVQLGSFTVLPVTYPSTSLLKKSTTHYLYIRPNVPSASASASMTVDDAEAEEGRTLFVANLPPDATEENLRALFGTVGPIEEIKFGAGVKEVKVEEAEETDSEEESEQESEEENEDTPAASTSKPSNKKSAPQPRAPTISPLFSIPPTHFLPTSTSAKITYLSALSLTRALLLPTSKARPWPTSSSPAAGLSHYLAQHAILRPHLSQVKAHADSSLAHHEHIKAAELAKITRQGQEIVDEDGFTLVVRGGRYGRNLIGGGVGVASKKWDDVKEEETGRKKKSKELKDFYRWQLREAKREDLANLRSKFAADKEKVEKLKGSRRFKPY